MKIKSVEMCLLFDFYGDILTDKQKEIFDLYYNEDMSLAEISENLGITRQGVRDSIIRSEAILTTTEEKLGLVARYGRIQSKMQKIDEALRNIKFINDSNYRNNDIKKLVSSALEITGNLSEL